MDDGLIPVDEPTSRKPQGEWQQHSYQPRQQHSPNFSEEKQVYAIQSPPPHSYGPAGRQFSGYGDQKQGLQHQPDQQQGYGYVDQNYGVNYQSSYPQNLGYGYQNPDYSYHQNQAQGPSFNGRYQNDASPPVRSYNSGYMEEKQLRGHQTTGPQWQNSQGQRPSRSDSPSGPQLVSTTRQIPEHLDLDNVMVRYESVPMKVDTHQHVTKAVLGSTQSAQNISNILGTYLEEKRANETQRLGTTALGPYHRSKLDVQMYNHLMHKLETLSAAVLGKHKNLHDSWVQALGPHRRRVFADLYNENDLVRCFSKEMRDGPMAFPPLDGWALGLEQNSFFSHRASTRPLTLNASMELLGRVRTVALVDDSGSMSDAGHTSWDADYRGGYGVESRWSQARRLLAEVAPLVSRHNPHGIDVHFLNRTDFYPGLHTMQDVETAFDTSRPSGGTYTGQRINDILDSYMCTLRYDRSLMPLNLLVFTDGEASDEEVLHWAIEEHITKIVQRGYPAHQFGVEFVQVGDDEDATRHLERLEEEVSRHHQKFQRDVVGVTPTMRMSSMNADRLLAIALSGIDARINGYMRKRRTNI